MRSSMESTDHEYASDVSARSMSIGSPFRAKRRDESFTGIIRKSPGDHRLRQSGKTKINLSTLVNRLQIRALEEFDRGIVNWNAIDPGYL